MSPTEVLRDVLVVLVFAKLAAEIAGLVADSEAPVGEDDIDDLRERATELLGHIVRHRQRGADLIYEAYETDIGGGD